MSERPVDPRLRDAKRRLGRLSNTEFIEDAARLPGDVDVVLDALVAAEARVVLLEAQRDKARTVVAALRSAILSGEKYEKLARNALYLCDVLDAGAAVVREGTQPE